MKKLFLISLMAMLCTVMAWADPVTTIEGLQDALNAGGEVTLGANINAEKTAVTFSSGTATLDLGGYTLSSSISASGDAAKGGLVVSGGSLTIKNGSITAANGNAILVSGGALIVKSGTISGGNEGIFATAGAMTIEGGTILGTGDNAIFTRGSALTITGGTFTGGWGAIQADNNVVLNISGGTFTGDDQEIALNAWSSIANANPTATISGGTYNGNGILPYGAASLTVTGGSYATNPVSYLNLESYVVLKPSTMYVVSARSGDEVAYNMSKCTVHASLSDAIEGASTGDEIYLYQNDATAITVSKSVTIRTNGHSTNVSAGSGYARADMGNNIAFTDNALAAFLMTDGTASLTLSENADISAAGVIHVNGNKTLTINSGVTVTYKRQGDLANIVVDNDAKLTVLGSGTFTPVMHSETRTIDGFTAEISTSASNHIGNRIIDVDGELVVGVKNDAANCPHFITSSLARGNAVMVNATGVATFNNADMHVASVSIKNYGNVTIHGGEYVSIATCKNEINNGWYAYHLNNEGIMTVNGGHFVGVQGAFANVSENAIVTINGGYFETVNGHNWKTGAANTGANADNHYALYVACYSVVNVYGGYYKVTIPSAGGGKVALVGNNDAYNTYGIVNLYGGNFQRKVEVQARKNAESSYPASVPSTSQWYGCFGSEAPLPAGYEYYETGDATYPYGVRVIPGTETAEVEVPADPTATIPWQQNTTWDATADPSAADIVPEENTIVTIPVGATVVVSNAAADIAAGGDEAEAKQIFISQDANLIVESGTMLTVGDGGVNIGNGGQLVVEPNAIVTIGAAGVITTEDEALVLTSTEDEQAVLLYDPTVAENTQPKATVKLTTKSKMLAGDPEWQYTYQRFAIPVKEAVIPTNDFDPAIHEYYDATEASYGFENYVWMWTGNAWATTTWTALEPFKGYQLANNSKNGGVTYTFSGNLIGNEDGQYHFGDMGFDYFGNSYTAAIDIETIVNHFASDVEATVWLYDYTNGSNWVPVTREDFSDFPPADPFKQIKSMEGFLLRSTTGSNPAVIDYEDAIWNNPTYASLRGAVPAPRRAISNDINNCAIVTIRENGGKYDMVKLVEKDYLTDEFDNGADASKYMEQEGLSLYAETNIGQLSRVATNNLNNILLSFRSGDNTNYTLQLSNVIGNEYAIRDNVTGAIIYVADDATYNFDQDANTTVPARFEIVAINRIMTGIDNVEQVSDEMAIYTVTGQYVGRDFSILPAGIYVVNGVKIIK